MSLLTTGMQNLIVSFIGTFSRPNLIPLDSSLDIHIYILSYSRNRHASKRRNASEPNKSLQFKQCLQQKCIAASQV